MSRHGAQRLHAVKVATAATAVVAVTAVILAVALNLVEVHRLVQGVDSRLSERLADVVKPDVGSGPPPGESGSIPSLQHDADFSDAPSFVWQVSGVGVVTPMTTGAPNLPVHQWDTSPLTVTVNGSSFRFDAVRSGSGWLVAGESVSQIDRIRGEGLIAEVLLGALLLVVTFAGSLLVGLRASAPIEQIRRRQSEFTADASHELRTPLSVIEAEVELALSRPREAADYRDSLCRVSTESARLRSIVNDLLWLARADGDLPSRDADETVNVAIMAKSGVDRFAPVADAAKISLSFVYSGIGRSFVRAQPDSIERLIGVLVDNSCRYTEPGGEVEVRVEDTEHRVTLTVDDSGPGIPEDHVELVFDRFHRATGRPGGTGLGLAIADTVVRSTNGSWSVGRGPLGGARMAVSWRHASVPPSETSFGDVSGD